MSCSKTKHIRIVTWMYCLTLCLCMMMLFKQMTSNVSGVAESDPFIIKHTIFMYINNRKWQIVFIVIIE